VLMKAELGAVWNQAAANMEKYAAAIVRSDAENKPVTL